ncbi:MAG: alanine:cation symporter family protein, partial [Ruminococcus sp.]|nr:alanine:cation symporter family protein [Ruminococcus sp.]
NIPDVFVKIFTEAFSFKSASGGIFGYAVSVGIRRGIFSNEAGLGSSPILHSSAGESSPQKQGMWSMFEVFFDTIICCTLTAVTLLCSTENFSVNESFSAVLGKYSMPFITAELGIFALCTIIGWYYCGEISFRYLTGTENILFCIIYTLVSASGAVFSAPTVWTISDIFNGLMAFPNLIGILLLMKNVKKE